MASRYVIKTTDKETLENQTFPAFSSKKKAIAFAEEILSKRTDFEITLLDLSKMERITIA